MHFTTTLLSLLATSALASATSLINPRAAPLKDWQVSAVGTYSPSGRPGNYPWLLISSTITDPNAYDLGKSRGGQEILVPANDTAMNCQAKWIYPDGPYGRRWACDNDGDNDNGYWYMEVLKVSDYATTDFELRFTRVIESWLWDQDKYRTYQGKARFTVGTNMRGQCGGSGVCSWGLRDENKPFPVKQAQIPRETQA